MSDAYTYEFTRAAADDLDEIAGYISTQLYAEESALALLEAVQAAIERACVFPLAAPQPNDPLLRAHGYRKLLVGNYLVFYIPNEAARKLMVMRVLYYARDRLREL